MKRKDIGKKKGKLTMDAMLSKALRNFMFGPLNQLIVNLAGEDGPIWEAELNKFNRKETCWSKRQIVEASILKAHIELLEFLGTVIVTATTSKFVAKEKFVCDIDGTAKVKIRYLNSNFALWFLSGEGKTEDPIRRQVLHFAKLRESSVNNPTIAEFGVEQKIETTLSQIFSLMERQKKGEVGTLLTNGYANIFYVRDSGGVLRAVSICWRGDGWRVFASEITHPSAWSVGFRVFF